MADESSGCEHGFVPGHCVQCDLDEMEERAEKAERERDEVREAMRVIRAVSVEEEENRALRARVVELEAAASALLGNLKPFGTADEQADAAAALAGLLAADR